MTEESERTWCLTCSFLGFYLFLKKHHIISNLVLLPSCLTVTSLTWRWGSSAHGGRGSSPRWVLGRRPSDAGACCCGGNRPSTLRRHHLPKHRKLSSLSVLRHTHTETSWHHHIYLLRWSAHTSDRPRKASWCLRHRSTSGNAATCCPPHAWPSCHACQWDTSDSRL